MVTGDKHFPREKDEDKIWRRIQKGSHILLLAPRRVGKTSLLRNLEHNPKAYYIFLYSIVQSCSTEHQYYKALIENLFKSEFTDKLSRLRIGEKTSSIILNRVLKA
jgi:AAA+ ATPase superfamily predicted ATPase